MTPCFHIDASGQRCNAPAAEGSIFCPQHNPESATAGQVRVWGFRLAALVLLLLILLNLYLYVKEVLP